MRQRFDNLPQSEKTRQNRLRERILRHTFRETPSPVRIEIAGIRVDLHSQDPHLHQSLHQFFAAYRADGLAHVRVCLHLSEEEGLWRTTDPEFYEVEGIAYQRDFVARHEDQGHVVGLVPRGLQDGYLNLLRWLLPPFLLDQNSALLHGAGVVRRRQGYVFFGQSGAGKSTCAKLIEQSDSEVRVLGDDVVILKMSETGARLITAPLGSGDAVDPPPNCNVPLVGLFALQQSPAIGIESLHSAEALRRLLGSMMMLTTDERLHERIELSAQFVMSDPSIQVLRFQKNGQFWKKVLDVTQ